MDDEEEEETEREEETKDELLLNEIGIKSQFHKTAKATRFKSIMTKKKTTQSSDVDKRETIIDKDQLLMKPARHKQENVQETDALMKKLKLDSFKLRPSEVVNKTPTRAVDQPNDQLFAMMKEIKTAQREQMEKQEKQSGEFRKFINDLKSEIKDIRSKMKVMNDQINSGHMGLESLLGRQ